MTAFRSASDFSGAFSRAKSRTPRTILRRRRVSSRMTLRSSSWGVPLNSSSNRLENVNTPVSGLLISWAIPEARRPIEASFSDFRMVWAACSLRRRSRSSTASTMALNADEIPGVVVVPGKNRDPMIFPRAISSAATMTRWIGLVNTLMR